MNLAQRTFEEDCLFPLLFLGSDLGKTEADVNKLQGLRLLLQISGTFKADADLGLRNAQSVVFEGHPSPLPILLEHPFVQIEKACRGEMSSHSKAAIVPSLRRISRGA